MTKPSRASSYSKSDDRAPAVRGAAHRAQSSIRDVDSRRGRRGQGGKAPPTFTSIREDALRRRGDRTQTGFWWHALCDELEHKNAARPKRGCGGTIVPAHRLVGAAGTVSAVISGRAGVAKNTTCYK